jgi:hypothetical protein
LSLVTEEGDVICTKAGKVLFTEVENASITVKAADQLFLVYT